MLKRKTHYGEDFTFFSTDTILLLTPLVAGAIVTTGFMTLQYGAKLCSNFLKKRQ